MICFSRKQKIGLLFALVVSVIVSFLVTIHVASAETVLPDRPTSRVMDMTNTLTDNSKDEIKKNLDKMHKNDQAEMYVVMVDTIGDESIEEYSMAIAEKWKPGKEDVDNGLILVVAKDDHKMRLEVGRGLEGTITDGMAGDIIDTMPNFFRKDDYGDGIIAATNKTAEFLDNPEEAKSESDANTPVKSILKFMLAVFIVIELLMYVFAYFAAAFDYGDEHRGRLLAIITPIVIAYGFGKWIDWNFSILDFIFGDDGGFGDGGGFGGGDDGGFFDGGFFDGGGCSGDW